MFHHVSHLSGCHLPMHSTPKFHQEWSSWLTLSSAIQTTFQAELYVMDALSKYRKLWHHRLLQVTASVPTSALLFNPSNRLCSLARPKERTTSIHVKEDADWQNWDSSEMGRLRIPDASQRVKILAESKKISDRYLPPRGVKWEVSKEALSSVASERVMKLARPKSKHLDTEDYKATAWMVSPSALLAQASPRINELATPLPRKTRAKK